MKTNCNIPEDCENCAFRKYREKSYGATQLISSTCPDYRRYAKTDFNAYWKSVCFKKY